MGRFGVGINVSKALGMRAELFYVLAAPIQSLALTQEGSAVDLYDAVPTEAPSLGTWTLGEGGIDPSGLGISISFLLGA
jgi:hypothetical protein